MVVEEKIAHQCLSVLELTETLGNVSEACRQRGMTRTQFYEYKKRFAEHGLAGLKDLPPVAKSHPFTTPVEVQERTVALSLERPKWGCVKLSDYLKLEGVSVSSPTVQDILIKNGLGTRYERTMELERRHLEEGLALNKEQETLLERFNPCYRERHVESSLPGELLSQDVYHVGTIKGVGPVYLHTVVDTYGSYAFGFLHTSKRPEAAVAILHNDALPFYRAHGLPVDTVLTDNGREFCGIDRHPYELCLGLAGIEHRCTPPASPQTNGFVERFHRTVKEEFFEVVFRQTWFTSLDQLQEALDAWLVHYNTERPHQGYRNRGRRPIDTVRSYSQSVKEGS